MQGNRDLLDRLRDLLEPVVDRHGFDLVAVELTGGAGQRTLRVSIDRPGGVGIDDCARLSRQISPLLDAEDPIQGPYSLEVSTPGIERPVQRERDFARFAGCEVRVKLFGMDSRKRIKGTLLGADGGVVRVQTADGAREIPLAEIERANLVLDLEQFKRMGQGLHPVDTGEQP